MRRAPKRDAELSGRAAISEKLLDLYKDVQKGFEDQRARTDEVMDNWDLYNCKLGEKQFYNGNSRIFVPFVRDAVNARVTRFANQVFPQSGRYVEATTGEADPPHATTALMESYVRKARLRTKIVPALLRNGDMEGQYTIYVSWKDRRRQAVSRQMVPVKVDGIEQPDLGEVEDFTSEEVTDAYPDVEVIPDPDFLVLPVTVDSIEDALEDGGSVTVIRRWSKGRIRRAIADGEIVEEQGETLIESMDRRSSEGQRDPGKELADAAGVKAGGKFAMIYETWTTLKVDGKHVLCRAYFGGEKQVLGCKQNPFWNDRCPIISAPVSKVAGVFKGRAPVSDVADLQVFANDTINEGADTAHFSAMPIVMTDPLKNPRVQTMVLGLAAVWETSPNDTKFAQFPELWRSALERAGAIKEQMFQTLGVNPAMIPQQTGGAKKRNQAEIANEQQVDMLTTADSVTILEEGVLTPLVERFAEYDHQFRDEAVTVQVLGEMGTRANMEEVEPIQLGKRFSFRWYGIENARNQAQMQQQIAMTNVLVQMPPESHPEYDLDISPIVAQLVENGFGPRLAPLIFKRKQLYSVDPETENDMLEHGFRVSVHPPDDDMAHLQAHMALMAQGDPHGNVREHVAMHQQQMQAKAMAASMPQQGQQGQPRGGGRRPKPGAQPAPPRQMKAPEGAIHPDQMARAGGGVQMPRKM